MKAGLLAIALAMVAGAGGAAASGEVYKWTDANGVTHFADAPPAGNAENVDRVIVRGGVTSSVPSAPPTAEDAPEEAGQGTGALPDTPENRAKVCREARANLELLQSNYQVSRTGSDGNPQPLDEEQRQQEIERASDQVSFYCRQG